MNLKMINSKVVTVEDMENIQYLDTFDLPNRVFEIYKQNTRGNDFIKIEDCKKKLIRNLMLSYEAPTKEGLLHKRVFYFGNLAIHLNLNEKSISYINNNFDIERRFKMDLEKKKVLNYIMGIEEKK